MAITNTLILTTTATTVFTAVGDQAITTVMFCNTDPVNTCLLDVHVVPAAGVPTTATTILKSLSLPATETFVMDAEKLILSNGDSIQAQEKAGYNQVVAATVSSVSI
jgi:hypothetical protein